MLRLPHRLRSPIHLALLTLPLLLVLAWIGWIESSALDHARVQMRQGAKRAATDLASAVSARLQTQFTELQFAAVALLGPDADPRHPDPRVVQTLRRFMALHPSLYAFNIQSPDGNTILWSTEAQPSQPITSGAAFTPLPSQPDFLLGQDRYAKRVGTHVITMRFRVRSSDGALPYLVGTPYRLDQLLRPPTDLETSLPLRFTVRDTRDGSVLGVVEHGRVRFDHAALAPAPTSVTVPIAGYPLAVQVNWPSSLAWQSDARNSVLRWGFELGSLLLLGLAMGGIVWLLRQRDQQVDLLHRMGQLQDFLAQVNQEAALMTEEDAFLQKVCDLAITRGQLALAVVGRPNAQAVLTYPAAAGRTAYLDGLFISTDPSIPEGQGPSGRVWRDGDGKPLFNTRFTTDLLAPWCSRAQALGLQATAVLLLRRQGERFALLMLYRGDDVAFNPAMQSLLGELANDVSRGLDTLLLRQTERALLDNAAAGIVIVRTRRIVRANAKLAAMLGRAPDELVDQSTRILYSDKAEFERVGAAYETLASEWQVALSSVLLQRADGQVVVCDLHGRLLPDGTTSVWTFSDITAREHQSRALLRMQRLYSALMFEGDMLLQARDARTILDRTCSSLTYDTSFHAVWIGQPNEAGRMEVLAQAGEGAAALQTLNIPLSDTDHAPLAVRAWQAEQVVFNNDLLADPHMAPWADFLREHRWAAALAAPVRRNGRIWAILAFVSPDVGVFDDDTLALCTRVADLLGHGLDELDLHDKLLGQERAEAQRARTDVLTGLPNRFALEQHLPHALERARRHGIAVAVGMIDLDDFKPINDQFGHDAGDTLLRQLAQQLQAQLRGTDYLARLGGDEFVLVLEDLDPAHAEPQLAIILQRLERVIQTPFDLGQGRQARVGMTLGLALFPDDGEDADTLLRNADAAMYQAKARKGDRAQWWRLWREGTLAAPQ